MREFEYRRTVFYQLNGHKKFEDSHENFDIITAKSTVVEDAITYLKDGSSYLRFPGSARAVAIATADFISRSFGEDFYEVLDKKNLMNGNDPWFKRYTDDKDIYDKILKRLNPTEINWFSFRMGLTHRILKEEYLLDSQGLKILPRRKWKSHKNS